MRYLVILAACGLLCGCEAVNERVQGSLDIFKTKAQLEADYAGVAERTLNRN